MKKWNIIPAIFSTVLLTACISCEGGFFPIKGNGDLKTTGRSVSSFSKINVSGSADVRFFTGSEYKIFVTVDSNLDRYTDIYASGDVLNIKTKHGNYLFTEYLVEVYCPQELTSISISGSGTFSGIDTIQAEIMDMNISGSGAINGTVICNNVNAAIEGSGSIQAEGSSKNLNVSISGSGGFDGIHLDTNDADVTVNGSGKVSVSVTNNLKARISGSGELRYRGTPQVDSSISGSGRVYPIN